MNEEIYNLMIELLSVFLSREPIGNLMQFSDLRSSTVRVRESK